MRMPTPKPLQPARADRLSVVWIFLLSLGGCASVDLSVREPNPSVATPVTRDLPPPKVAMQTPVAPTSPAGAATRRGGYYLDDGPDAQIPEGLLDTPDAEPRVEPLPKDRSSLIQYSKKRISPLLTSVRLFSGVGAAGTAKNSTVSVRRRARFTTCTK